MGTQGSNPVGGASSNDGSVDFGEFTVPAQQLEAMVNWRMIHGIPVEGSQYISVDPSKLAEHAGFIARFPLRLTDPAHAVFLQEGMQRYRDALGKSGIELLNTEQFKRDWENFWSDDKNVSLGMRDIVRDATLSVYQQMMWKFFSDGGEAIDFDGMVQATTKLNTLMVRIQSNEFGYNQLHDLQTLAGMVEAGDLKARLAWSLIDILAEGAGPAHKLFAFSIMDQAFLAGKDRLDLLVRLAALLKVTSHVADGKPYDDIVGKSLDLLRHSQLTPEIERSLTGIIDKMLDPSNYPPENGRLRDEQGNILAKSPDIERLVPNFLDALYAQSIVAGSLPARLLTLAADNAVQVNGAFIALANLSLAQSARGGTLATYYGEPLFDPGVRARLSDLSFSPNNVNAIDAFLEEQVYDSRRGGGGSAGPMRGMPFSYMLPSAMMGMSAMQMGAQAALLGPAMAMRMPMTPMMPLVTMW